MKRKIGTAVGVIALIAFILWSPFDESSGEFSKVLRGFGRQQAKYSDELTTKAVSGAEGVVVAKRQINGANWSIPNIIRFLLNGERDYD